MGLLAGLYEPDRNRLYRAEPGRFRGDNGEFLRAVYDYRILAETFDVKEAFAGWENSGMAAFSDLLPVENRRVIECSGTVTGCSKIWGRPGLFLKDDRTAVSGTSLYRGACLAVALARQNEFSGVSLLTVQPEVVEAFAAVARTADLAIRITVPEESPAGVEEFDLPAGVEVVKVSGPVSEVFQASCEQAEEEGFYRATLGDNPYIREAYKTIAFELYLQMNRVPERVYFQHSEGEIIAGLTRGFEELKITGWTSSIPRIYPVIGPGRSSRIRWLSEFKTARGDFSNRRLSRMEQGPLDLYFALEALEKTGGKVISLSPKDLTEHRKKTEIEKINPADGNQLPPELLTAFERTEPAEYEAVVLLDTGFDYEAGEPAGEERDE